MASVNLFLQLLNKFPGSFPKISTRQLRKTFANVEETTLKSLLKRLLAVEVNGKKSIFDWIDEACPAQYEENEENTKLALFLVRQWSDFLEEMLSEELYLFTLPEISALPTYAFAGFLLFALKKYKPYFIVFSGMVHHYFHLHATEMELVQRVYVLLGCYAAPDNCISAFLDLVNLTSPYVTLGKPCLVYSEEQPYHRFSLSGRQWLPLVTTKTSTGAYRWEQGQLFSVPEETQILLSNEEIFHEQCRLLFQNEQRKQAIVYVDKSSGKGVALPYCNAALKSIHQLLNLLHL